MGFGPDQVDRWTPGQFMAVWRGWKTANSQATVAPPSDDEFIRAVQGTMH
jgi:hypothetical protein